MKTEPNSFVVDIKSKEPLSYTRYCDKVRCELKGVMVLSGTKSMGVSITAIGRSGQELSFELCIPHSTMTEMCKKWLKQNKT